MKIAITADWHLSANNRVGDMADTISVMADSIVGKKAGAVVICGDLYRSWFAAGPVERGIVYAFMKRMRDAGIQCVVFPGNHDVSETDAAGSTVNIREFGELGLDSVAFTGVPAVMDVGAVTAIIIPHLTRAAIQQGKEEGQGDYSDCFAEHLSGLYAQAIKTGKPVYVFAHALFLEALPPAAALSESARAVRLSALSSDDYPKIRKVFLGDIHKHMELKSGDTPVVYCGSPDIITFGEISDKKGYVLLDTVSDSYDFVPLDNRRFLDVSVDLDADTLTCAGSVSCNTSMESKSVLAQEAIEGAIVALKDEIKDAIVRVSVSGARDKISTVNRDAVRTALVACAPNGIKSLNFVINYAAVNAGSGKSMLGLSEDAAFDEWIASKEYPDGFREQVYSAGKELLCGLKD